MILFILPAATIYDSQGRVAGWKATPASRDSLKQLKALIPRLRELNPSRIVASDLDSQTSSFLARKLDIPFEEWNALRRLNVGKLHGTNSSKFQELYENVQAQWKSNPDIPIKGGDSLTSYQKRMAATKERLSKLEGVTIVVASAREIEAITGSGGAQRGRVYEWQGLAPSKVQADLEQPRCVA